jgi:hypothetical protein
MTCINIAGAIKTVIDTPLLDKDGNIAKESQEALEIGNQYLKAISNV